MPLLFLFGIIVSIPYMFELSVRSPMHFLPIHLLNIGIESCSIACNRATISCIIDSFNIGASKCGIGLKFSFRLWLAGCAHLFNHIYFIVEPYLHIDGIWFDEFRLFRHDFEGWYLFLGRISSFLSL